MSFWSILRILALLDEMLGLLQLFRNDMDWELILCLWWTLRHAQTRGINWFQQPRSFRLELKMCFGPSPTRAHGWMKQPDVLQFLMNSKDRELPSCLWVLRHVNRRGIDWLQRPPWSFRLGLAMCFGGPFGT